MSDADDGFDREAEKEKLREKYENEQADRAATQQMSELLLQGATMTNRHCGDCGNPIFRHQGREFCPVCNGEREAPQGRAGTAPDRAAAARESGGQAPAEEAATGETEDADLASSAARSDTGESAGPSPAPARARTAASDETRVAAACADLAETVSALARRAAAADDPRRARELAEAAREAAEALSAIR